jgi:abortive infection bacteriophage resistance protein
MSGSQKIPFAKPWLSHSDQVQLLQQRGLGVSDPQAAEQFLSHLNYYRLSGYCLAFENGRHSFTGGVTFEDVVAAYHFDLTLRDLLTEALEVVEVDLRAAIAYGFGQQYGAFGHINPANFYTYFNHQVWLDGLRKEADRSSELFVEHFRQTYVEFPDLPVWIVTEVMSFGTLSHMYKGMLKPVQRAVAKNFGIQASFLKSWMHHCVYVRNLCAHHSRLWDRVWAIRPQLPPIVVWQHPLLPSDRHLFATLLVLRKLLSHIPAAKVFTTQWKQRVEQHIAQPPAAPNPLRRMGLTNSWLAHPVWA